MLFFGITTDLVGQSSIEMELSAGMTVKGIKKVLLLKYPALEHIDSYAIAVNEAYASDALLLKHSDVIAIIPPVSGG